MRMNIRSKLLLGFTGVLVILVALSFFNNKSQQDGQTATKMVIHTEDVLAQCSGVLSGMVNMETGFRGFLLTGEEAFLDPYKNGLAEFQSAINELNKLTSDNPTQIARWAEIVKMEAIWHDQWAEKGISLRRDVIAGSAEMQAVIDYESSGGGKQSMDGIRAIVAQAIQMESDLMVKRSAANDAATTLAQNINLWGTILAVLVGLIIAFLLSRSLSNAAQQLASVADNIAKGELDVKITIKSKDELGDTANAFGRMISAISALVSDAGMLVQAAVDGKLATRADASKHQGDYRKIVEGVNKTLDAVIGPLNVAANYVDRISKGDLPPKITDTYNGDFNVIKNNLNLAIDNINSLVADAGILVQAAIDGKLATRADAGKHQGDYKKIVDGVNKTLDLVVTPINETIEIMKKLAEGDLTSSMNNDYKGDFDVLKTAMNSSLLSVGDTLSQINNAVDQVAEGSQQVSQASQSLSQGATEQASSLEEITSSVTEIASQTKQNTASATQMTELAKTAKKNAEMGNVQMKDLVAAMADINKSADEIKKIVKAIDDISFQINLLALNANVEAARAGKYGKGFAVVAEEVRNLAVRSANSVKETTRMVDETITNINRGNTLVEGTAKQLNEIVAGAGQVAALSEEVATAGKEQAQGLEQVSLGLNQIDQVTQANTASAEESASASEELSAQSQEVKNMLSRFKLRAREGKMNNAEMMQMLKAELAKQQGVHKNPTVVNRSTGIVPVAGKKTQRVNPADVISLDDDNFGKF